MNESVPLQANYEQLISYINNKKFRHAALLIENYITNRPDEVRKLYNILSLEQQTEIFKHMHPIAQSSLRADGEEDKQVVKRKSLSDKIQNVADILSDPKLIKGTKEYKSSSSKERRILLEQGSKLFKSLNMSERRILLLELDLKQKTTFFNKLFPKDQIEILNLVEGEEQRHLVRGCKHQNELLECLKANKCDNILDNYKKFSVSDLPEETIKDIFRELDEKEKLVFFNSISIDEKLELLQFVTKDEQVQLVEICNEQHNLIEHLLQTEQTPILENLMDSKLKETLIQFYEVTSNIKKLPDIDKNEAAESQQSVNNFLGGMDMLTTLHEIRSGLQSFFSNSNSTTKPKNDAGKKTDKQQKDQPPFSGGWGWW